MWTFPVVLGRGKRLFSETVKPSALRLVHSQVSTTGVVMSTYVPNGDIRPGSFASVEPSEKELARHELTPGNHSISTYGDGAIT
jgi:hypothetical protein